MAAPNVDKMTLKDLLELDAKVQKAIAAARDRERSELKQKIEALAQGSGFSVSDLFGSARGGRAGKASGVKYMNPENRNETWTGRGRKPNWLVEKLENGASLDEFSVR